MSGFTRNYRNAVCRVLFIVLVLFVTALPIYSQGGGIANYEVGTPNVGEAYAGHAAIARDASTAFLNPAGMTRLKGTHAIMGAELSLLNSGFAPDGRNTAPGPAGYRVGGPIFIPGSYFTRRLNDRIAVGFSFNSPFAIKVDYDPTWVGRYWTSYVSFVTLEARPSIAWKANKWLSLGFAVSVERAALRHKNYEANVLDPGFADAFVDVDFHDWGFGTHYSALIEPTGKTRIGLTYRSKVDFEMKGSVKATGFGPNLGALLAKLPPSDNRFYLPRGANVSLYHEATDKLALLADTGWSGWNTFGTSETKAANGTVVKSDSGWRNTWRIGLGMRYKLSERMLLQAGSSYDSAPVSYWDRKPLAPMDREWRYAGGLQYAYKPGLTFGISAVYKDMGPARIETSIKPGVGRLSGIHPKSRMPFIALTMAFGPDDH